MKMKELRKQIYLIEDFWSSQKCDEYISKTESIGYQPAKVQTENGFRVVDFIRNNNRVICKDFELANSLWDEVKDFAPKKIGESVAIGLNELFRFYRYEPGQQFLRHRDQSYMRSNGEASYYTFMIYLNDDFEGGETTFMI